MSKAGSAARGRRASQQANLRDSLTQEPQGPRRTSQPIKTSIPPDRSLQARRDVVAAAPAQQTASSEREGSPSSDEDADVESRDQIIDGGPQ